MFLVYIDDVKENDRAYFCGLMIEASAWLACRDHWRAMLGDLRERRGFRTTREIHATKLLSAHGNFFDERPSSQTCVATHLDILKAVVAMPTLRIFPACGPLRAERRVFERLITRVNKTMEVEHDHALLICDEGKTYDDLLTTLRETNFIKFADRAVDAPLLHIVEDIVYRKSKNSFMVQAADACVYTLFRHEDHHPRLHHLGLDRAFDAMRPAIFLKAAPRDPDGIIRC